MLLVCIGFTLNAAIITFFYDFHKISYVEMAAKLGFPVSLDDQTALKGELIEMPAPAKETKGEWEKQ